MKFSTIGSSSQRSLGTDRLDGGINVQDLPSQVEANQLTDACNVWWEAGALRTRPGFGVLRSANYEAGSTVTCSDSGYPMPDGTPVRILLTKTMQNSQPSLIPVRMDYDGNEYPFSNPATGEAFGNIPGEDALITSNTDGSILFINSTGIYGYNADLSPDTWSLLNGTAYIPKVLINGKGVASPSVTATSGGQPLEGRNLLTPSFRASYTTDGTATTFYLPYKMLDDGVVYAVLTRQNGTSTMYSITAGQTESRADIYGVKMCLNRVAGYVWFVQTSNSALSAPAAAGISNNLVITASKPLNQGKETILGMRFGTWFGGDNSGIGGGTRFFVSGNPQKPNLICWSDVNNALYFPENNYAYIGDSAHAVTAFAKQDDMLVMFKENELYYATYAQGNYTASDVQDGMVVDVTAASAQFPITQLYGGPGCDCPHTIQLCGNRLIWLHSSGRICTLVSADRTSECNVREISANIGPIIKKLPVNTLKAASSDDDGERYLLLMGTTLLLLHYTRGGYTRMTALSDAYQSQKQLVWYVWNLPCDAGTSRIMAQNGKILLIDMPTSSAASTKRIWQQKITDDVMKDGVLCPAPVPFWWQSCLYSAGLPERHKMVTRVYSTVTANNSLLFRLVDENGNRSSAEKTGTFYHIPLSCGRMRLFGVRAEGTGVHSTDGLLVKYQVCGLEMT